MAGRLARYPLEISTEWTSKTVTTDPPRLIPHEEWRLVLHLRSETPFRLVSLLRSARELDWGLRTASPTTAIDQLVHFFPYDWSKSDRVQVAFAGRRFSVSDEALKADPRSQVLVVAPATAVTGEVIPMCEVPRHRVGVAALALAVEDTENRREHRWRVRPRLADELPDGLEQLASGHQTGVVRLDS